MFTKTFLFLNAINNLSLGIIVPFVDITTVLILSAEQAYSNTSGKYLYKNGSPPIGSKSIISSTASKITFISSIT